MLAGKTVVCVGHGETSTLWYNSISSQKSDVPSPSYTSFAELVPEVRCLGEKKDGSSSAVLWVPKNPPFRQPHLV
jgi:hypothetical protein